MTEDSDSSGTKVSVTHVDEELVDEADEDPGQLRSCPSTGESQSGQWRKEAMRISYGLQSGHRAQDCPHFTYFLSFSLCMCLLVYANSVLLFSIFILYANYWRLTL